MLLNALGRNDEIQWEILSSKCTFVIRSAKLAEIAPEDELQVFVCPEGALVTASSGRQKTKAMRSWTQTHRWGRKLFGDKEYDTFWRGKLC